MEVLQIQHSVSLLLSNPQFSKRPQFHIRFGALLLIENVQQPSKQLDFLQSKVKQSIFFELPTI